MDINQVVEVLKIERECVKRAVAGCDRNCESCELVMLDEIVLEAYDKAIEIIEAYYMHTGGDENDLV